MPLIVLLLVTAAVAGSRPAESFSARWAVIVAVVICTLGFYSYRLA